jgi:predicted ribosome quality control (RQC) complex YloA/Tae2 family protein
MNSAPIELTHPLLLEARLQEVRQPAPLDLVLVSHRPGEGSATWLLSADPQGARMVQTFVLPKNAPRPGQFLLWLRTRLVGSRIAGVQIQDGQSVDIAFRKPEGLLHLVLEINGRESNVLLLDGEQRVLAALRPSAKAPGAAYQPPERLHRYPRTDPSRLPVTGPDAARQLDALWRDRMLAWDLEARRTGALRRIRTQLDKLRRRLKHIEVDRESALEAEALREQGELLQIHRTMLVTGMEEVTIPNEFQPERPPVTIRLDPALDASANIERLFQRYRKARDGAAHVERRLRETRHELEHWAGLQQSVQAAEDAGQFRALMDGLPGAERMLADPPPPAPKAREPGSAIMTRVSADGFTIYVGRSKLENDEVTFRIGRGRDWWFHAQGVPGAHVLVRNPSDGPLPPATLRQAAWLAAYYSKGRAQGSLEVTCTQRKHVRKIKGGEPGQVTHALGRTFWVDLDDAQGRAVLGEVERGELDV